VSEECKKCKSHFEGTVKGDERENEISRLPIEAVLDIAVTCANLGFYNVCILLHYARSYGFSAIETVVEACMNHTKAGVPNHAVDQGKHGYPNINKPMFIRKSTDTILEESSRRDKAKKRNRDEEITPKPRKAYREVSGALFGISESRQTERRADPIPGQIFNKPNYGH
ncbi:hypothetical protein FOL47_002054, partial [Perkinsus chesapeaki]